MKREIGHAYGGGEGVEDNGQPINQFHYNRICGLLKDHGGEVVQGNERAPEDKNLRPTIILNPKKDSPVMSEEIFGPLFPVFTYKKLDEPIKYITEA